MYMDEDMKFVLYMILILSMGIVFGVVLLVLIYFF